MILSEILVRFILRIRDTFFRNGPLASDLTELSPSVQDSPTPEEDFY